MEPELDSMERDRIKSASGKEPELYESPGLAPVRKYGKGVALTYHVYPLLGI